MMRILTVQIDRISRSAFPKGVTVQRSLSTAMRKLLSTAQLQKV